jgi:peroxiredoxin
MASLQVKCLPMTPPRSLFKRRASTFALLAAIAGLAAVTAWWLPNERTPVTPAVLFTLLDGTSPALADFRGRAVLINFWSTSCPPCIEELPDLNQLYRELHPRGLEMIAVAMPYDPPLHVQNFAAQHALPYPIALDVEGQVVRAFGGVPYIPVTFVIAPDGDIVYQQTGKLDITRARRIIEPFLAPPDK